MKGRLAFIAGLAAGYVVGSRAGRSAYESLRQRIQEAASNPQVRNVLGRAKGLAEEKAPQVVGAVEGVASTVASVAGANTSQDSSDSDTTAQDAGTARGSSSASANNSSGSSRSSSSGSGRGSRSRSGSGSAASSTGAVASVATDTPTPETAQEAAEVFQEQLPEEAGPAPSDEGDDESISPTASA